MTTGEGEPDYKLLTSMLHWKTETPLISVAQLDEVFNTLCKTKGKSGHADKKIVDLISDEASACLGAAAGLNLENKIVLSIGIRLASERFMIAKINDESFVKSIQENQTSALADRFRKSFPNESETLAVLERVTLITPENIHVNAFMYEPIVDMSDDHLKRLYRDITKLT